MAKAKKTARKTTARKSALPKGFKRIGDKKHVVDLSDYTKAKSATGKASLNCGDDVAKQLTGKTLEDVYKAASKVLREPVAALVKQYKHLNVGMQRMNLGNRIRGAQAE